MYIIPSQTTHLRLKIWYRIAQISSCNLLGKERIISVSGLVNAVPPLIDPSSLNGMRAPQGHGLMGVRFPMHKQKNGHQVPFTINITERVLDDLFLSVLVERKLIPYYFVVKIQLGAPAVLAAMPFSGRY
jgi:hypothetical protein